MNSNPLTAIDTMSPLERYNFDKRIARNTPIQALPESNWFSRTYEQMKAYNSLSLLTQLEPLNNSYLEVDYSATNDQYVNSNLWISSTYPDIWQDILESKSSGYSRQLINNVKKNHRSKAIIGQGSVLGNLAGGILAGFTDPINYILPMAGTAFKTGQLSKSAYNSIRTVAAQKAKDATKNLSMRDRAIYNAFENVAATMLVEPLLQQADVTRDMEDLVYDTVGAAAVGAGFSAAFDSAIKGTSKIREKATEATYGTKTVEEFWDKNGDKFTQKLKDTPEKAAWWSRIEDSIDKGDLTDLTRTDLNTLERYSTEAVAEIVPSAGAVKGINNIVRFLAVNPLNRLISSESSKVRGIARKFLENNLEEETIDSADSVVPIESKVKLVAFVNEQKLREYAYPFGKFLEENPVEDLTILELREMVSHVIRDPESEGKVNKTNTLLNSYDDVGNRVQVDPLAKIRGNQKAMEFLQERVDHYQKEKTALDATLNSVGHTSSTLREVDEFGLDFDTYITRVADNEKVEAGSFLNKDGVTEDGFFNSILDGITENENLAIAEIKNIIKQYDQEILTLRKELKLPNVNKRRIEKKLKQLNEQKDSANSKLAQLQNPDTKAEALRDIAFSVHGNYLKRSRDISVVSKPQKGLLGPTEVIARKVNIPERYLSDYLINDSAALLERAQVRLMPKVIFADEMMRLAPGKVRLNDVLLNEIDTLKSMYEDFVNQVDGENAKLDFDSLNQKASEIYNLIDSSKDSVQLSQLLHSLLVITRNPSDPTFFKNPDTGDNFKGIEEVVDFVTEQVGKRSNSRNKMDSLLLQRKETEDKIKYVTKDTNLHKFWEELTDYTNKKTALESEPLPEYPFYTVLQGQYLPEKGGLSFPNEVKYDPNNTDVEVKFMINKRGNLEYRVVVDGKTSLKPSAPMLAKRALPRKGDQQGIDFDADNVEAYVLRFRTEKGGPQKWMWISSEDFMAAKKKGIDESDSSDVRDQLRKEVAKESQQVGSPNKNKDLADAWSAFRDKEIAKLESDIESIKQDIENALDAIPSGSEKKSLRSLSNEYERVVLDFDSQLKIFGGVTDSLNEIAKRAASINRNNKDLESINVDKEFIEAVTALNPDDPNAKANIFEVIGFDKDYKFQDRYSRSPFQTKAALQGRPRDQIITGHNEFQGDVFVSMNLAQNARSANIDFYSNPAWLYADILREGELDSRQFSKVKKNIDFLSNQLQNKNMSALDSQTKESMLRIVRNMNYMRYMGMVTISSLGDFGNAVGTLGFTRYVGTLWEYMSEFKDRKNMSALSSIHAAGEIAMGETRNTSLYGMDATRKYYDPITNTPVSSKGISNKSRGVVQSFDRATNQNSKIMGFFNNYGNFLGQWNQFNKRLVGLGLEDMLVDISIKRTKGQSIKGRDLAVARSLGFTDKDFNHIYSQWAKHGSSKRKRFGGDFLLSGSGFWDSGADTYAYEMKVRSAVDSIIVTPGAGDVPIFFKDSRWAPFVQFKSFLMASTSKMFLPMIQRGVVHRDLNQVAMIFSTTMLGVLSHVIHSVASGDDPFADPLVEDPETGEQVRKGWKTEMVLNGIDRGGSMAMLFETSNYLDRFGGVGAHSLFGGELNKKYRSRSLADLAFGPAGGLLGDLQKSLTVIPDVVKGDVSEGQLSAVRRLIPMQNSIWVKAFAESAPAVIQAFNKGDSSKRFAEQYSEQYRTLQGRLFDLMEE